MKSSNSRAACSTHRPHSCCVAAFRWGKPVIVYGPPSLGKDHPIIKFLAEQQRCTSVSFFKQG